MPRTLCKCTGSAKRFHESQTEEDCSYINAYYTFQRSKDPESRNRMYQFLRCLGHTYDDALKTANEETGTYQYNPTRSGTLFLCHMMFLTRKIKNKHNLLAQISPSIVEFFSPKTLNDIIKWGPCLILSWKLSSGLNFRKGYVFIA